MLGETLHVKDVSVPLMSITCETDHIAAWKDCYRGVQKMGSRSKTFIVSESGHIAGIVNPPSKKKYGHYTNTDLKGDAEAGWRARPFTRGPGGRAGRPGCPSARASRFRPAISAIRSIPALAPAPGTYVVAKPKA